MNIGKRIIALAALAGLWVAAFACVLLPGCSTVGGVAKHDDSARLVVVGATMAYVRTAPTPEARYARAKRIRAVVADLEATASGEPLQLQSLALYFADRLPVDLLPEEKALALEIIGRVGRELSENIGHGGLESATPIDGPKLLSWIDYAAAFYAPTG